MQRIRSILVLGILLALSVSSVLAQRSRRDMPALYNAALAKQLVSHSALSSLWWSSTAEAIAFRRSVVSWIDSLYDVQLIQKPYHSPLLRQLLAVTREEMFVQKTDSLHVSSLYFLDAVLATGFDLYRGHNPRSFVGYDVISRSYQHRDDTVLLAGVLAAKNREQVRRWLFSLEPTWQQYGVLKKELLRRQQLLHQKKVKLLTDDTLLKIRYSMQLYRWLHHFELDRFLLVNIAAAEASYVERGKAILTMRTIVGKPSTPTPRFASYCRQLILYPYWYVPSSIAIGEYLSKIKKNPGWLDQRNMQVIDGKGRVVDHHQLSWRSFSAGYFPYTIRQSTGCDNALGVLKFDIETPYGVYLHDTNNKTAFLQRSRFLSHGCIRLEEPLLLGNKLLGGGLDTTYLQSCFEDKKPFMRPLSAPLPVFCLYLPASADSSGSLRVHRNVYKLLIN